jgi:hypothetical protein
MQPGAVRPPVESEGTLEGFQERYRSTLEFTVRRPTRPASCADVG